jgi:hypothetical protein
MGRVNISVSWSQTDYKVPRRREVYQLLFPTTEASLYIPVIRQFLLKKLSPFHKIISMLFQFLFFHTSKSTEQAQLH